MKDFSVNLKPENAQYLFLKQSDMVSNDWRAIFRHRCPENSGRIVEIRRTMSSFLPQYWCGRNRRPESTPVAPRSGSFCRYCGIARAPVERTRRGQRGTGEGRRRTALEKLHRWAAPNAPSRPRAAPLTAIPQPPSRSAAIPPGPPYPRLPSTRRRAAIEAHDCKSPFAEAGRTEIMLLASVLAVVERLAWTPSRERSGQESRLALACASEVGGRSDARGNFVSHLPLPRGRPERA